ncbi:TetR/AcrR family transcriptional regulator [candidate division KSB1 bacterium]
MTAESTKERFDRDQVVMFSQILGSHNLDVTESITNIIRGTASDLTEPQERIRERIMDAAAARFIRFGFRGANMGDVADDAGMGKGTLYSYFGGKKALLLACVAREKLKLVPEIEAVLDLPVAERIEAYLKVMLRFVLTAPLTSSLLTGTGDLMILFEEIGYDHDQFQADMDRVVAFLISLITPVTPNLSATERQKLAMIVATVSQLPAHLSDPHRQLGLSIDEFVDIYAAVLARGIANTVST